MLHHKLPQPTEKHEFPYEAPPVPPAKIRDATRKDWPGPRWPFCAMRGPDGRISVPLPLNEN